MKSFRPSYLQMLCVVLASAMIIVACNSTGGKISETPTQETAIPVEPSEQVSLPEQTTSEPQAAPVKEEEITPVITEKTEKPKPGAAPNQEVRTIVPGNAVPVTNTQVAVEPVSNSAPPAQVNTGNTTKEPVDQVEVKTTPPAPVVKETVAPKPTPEEPAKPAAVTNTGWVVPEKEKNRKNPVVADAASISAGRSLYLKHCASCHGKSGAGDGTKAAQLKEPLASFKLPVVQNQTDGSLFYKIWEGRDDMPRYKKKLPDEEDIWNMVNFIRTLK